MQQLRDTIQQVNDRQEFTDDQALQEAEKILGDSGQRRPDGL